jgi:hypothetical protein
LAMDLSLQSLPTRANAVRNAQLAAHYGMAATLNMAHRRVRRDCRAYAGDSPDASGLTPIPPVEPRARQGASEPESAF